MTQAEVDAILEFNFREGADPRPTMYYIRAFDAAEAEISTDDWTDYAPVAIARSNAAWTAAATSGARRQVTNAAQVELSAAAVVPGANVEIHYVTLETAASAGRVVIRRQLDPAVVVQNGNPVRIPAGQLIAHLTPDSD